MIQFCFIVLFVVTSSSVFAGKYVGITVEYNDGTSLAQMNRVVKSQKLTVVYRSRYAPIDQLRFKSNKGFRLSQICNSLKSEPTVKSCSLTKKTYTLEKGTCITGTGIPSVIGDDLNLKKVSLALKCPEIISMSPQSKDIQASNGSDFSFGKVTEFWAQEAVGAPETRNLMNELNTDNNLDKVKIGLIDGHFDTEGIIKDIGVSPELSSCIGKNSSSETSTQLREQCGVFDSIASILNKGNDTERISHGTSVAHLIAGKSDVGIGTNAQIHSLATADGSSYAGAFDRTLDSLSSNNPPNLINMSMGVPSQYRSLLNQVADKAVLVIASGNEFPDPIEESKRDKTPPKIIVGSIAPDGTHSTFSREGEGVSVVAPSDIFIRSKRGDGSTDELFGGTSGATPVVSGALSNVMSLLPGIKTKELQRMIDRTSIKTHANFENDQNGAGSINAYALLLAAKRLKKGWPRNKRELRGRNIYNFKAAARKLKNKALEILKISLDCDKKKEALKLLRRAFFLNPNNNSIRRHLSGMYKQEGYHAQAKFYGPPEDLIDDESVQQRVLNHDLILAVKNGDISLIEKLLKRGASITSRGGKHSGEYGSNDLVAIASRLIDDKKLRNTTINILIESGARILPMTSFGKLDGSKASSYMFDWAINNDRADLVEKWIASDKPGEKLNVDETVNGKSLLTMAMENNELELSSKLIARGADMYDTSYGLESAMSSAIESGNLEAVKLLVDNGYDLKKFQYLDDGFEWWFKHKQTKPEIEKFIKENL
jgi:ankyrin repeat protein